MSKELKMLTNVKESTEDCTFDHFSPSNKCLVPNLQTCTDCIFEGRFRSKANKRLHEIIPIIFEG